MTLILHQLPDGKLAITREGITGSFQDPDGWTRLPPVAEENLPTVFRGSWRWAADTAQVVVDMTSARAHVMAAVRTERDKRLLASDAKKARWDDIGTTEQKAALADYRQALRDVPLAAQVDTDAITDPVALAAYAPVWPTEPL